MIRARSFVFHLVGIRDCLMHMLCCHDLVLPNIPSMPADSKVFRQGETSESWDAGRSRVQCGPVQHARDSA